MQWNYSRCADCRHESETMTFGGSGPKLTCPKCKSVSIEFLGYPVWKNGKYEYQPEPDASKAARKVEVTK